MRCELSSRLDRDLLSVVIRGRSRASRDDNRRYANAWYVNHGIPGVLRCTQPISEPDPNSYHVIVDASTCRAAIDASVCPTSIDSLTCPTSTYSLTCRTSIDASNYFATVDATIGG